jgi:outer membrane protein
MTSKTQYARRLIAIACLAACSQAALADELLVKARELLETKQVQQAEQAYALLIAEQSQRAGDVDYDFLLGVAALDSGKPNEAVFALERVLTANPANGPARLKLAQAYFMLGEPTASRLEFETVKLQQPPDQVNKVIQQYLDLINQRASTQTTSLRGFVESFIGYDSNVNIATSASQVALPFFGGAIGNISPDFRQRSDHFVGVAAGISGRYALPSDLALNGYLTINQRRQNDLNQFDLGYVESSVVLTKTRGVDEYSAGLQFQKVTLDRDSFRNTVGVSGDWQHRFDDQRTSTLYTQVARLNYNGVQSARDANRYQVGARYSHVFAGTYSPVAFANAYIGREEASRNDLPNLDQKFFGIRTGGQLLFSTNFKLTANASVEKRRYGGEEILFATTRRDTQLDFNLGLSYSPALLWTVRPEIFLTRSRSNIVLNEYTRRQFLITVRRDFE